MKTQLCLLAALAVASPAIGQLPFNNVVYTEDFESAVLQPSPQEQPLPPIPVWTDEFAGWTVDDSGVPTVGNPDAGVEDWEGWAFVDGAFWVSADDQNRSQFFDGNSVDGNETPFASGVVAVADPDEWDDFTTLPDPNDPTDTIGPADALGFYNAFITTPSIDVSSLGNDPIAIQFASSWRDEAFDDGDLFSPDGNNQTATLEVSVDGGAFTEILRWDSDENSSFFKGDSLGEAGGQGQLTGIGGQYSENELIGVVLDETGADTVQFRFGMIEAGNDWWWAVDNIQVGSIPEPTSALLVALGGLIAVARRR